MIRDAERQDIERINQLVQDAARGFNVEEDTGVAIDPPTIDAVLRYHIRHKDAVVFVYEDEEVDSFFVGALLPHYLDIRVHVAHEKISGGPHREELWREFIKWAKEQGAPACVRSCYDPEKGSRFRRVK